MLIVYWVRKIGFVIYIYLFGLESLNTEETEDSIETIESELAVDY